MPRLRRCAHCGRWMWVSRDLVWACRAVGCVVLCRAGRGCQRPAERIEAKDWL